MIFLTTLQLSFQSKKCKKALCLAEISCSLFLVADCITYLYDGVPGVTARYIVYISNFLVFTLIQLQLIFFNLFIIYSFMETGRFASVPESLKICFLLPVAAIILIIISQFTGLYYSFDANNFYHRNSVYFISLIFPVMMMFIQIVFVVRYRELLTHRKILSITITMLFLIVAGVLQFFMTGVAFNDYAAFLGCLNMFLMSILDQTETLIKSSHTDVQSGLPNVYGFIDIVDNIIKTKDITKYNSYYFDMIRMGRLNSIYGKEIGDEIIIKYARYIKSKIGHDECVGRLGGNYFVALIRCDHTDEFLKLLSDVPVVLKTFDNKMETIHISANAGITAFESNKINPGVYISYSAEALYYAKNVYKKPYVFFDDNLKKEIDERKMLEEALSKAIENEEFITFYQPKVSTNAHQLSGAEALIRWKRNGSLVPPVKFIPILEKNEKICQVDFWVLNQVCHDLKRWLEDGFTPMPVSVNFSRRHLGNPNLADEIVATIERNDIPKSLIEIEITETIDEYSIDVLKTFVEKLQAKGVRAAIDDFGSGSSSLNLIHQIKFDVLKIDKELVDIENEIGRTLLTRTVELAQLLGMEVIAEGVETQKQVDFLKSVNCPHIQGYFFDKPLEKKEFEKRLIKKDY
ncbi:MAG: EAL domain-containing protein [Treponema sp.]|uniref:putative bifunctional diguanylate cyclase/phosphodiesterase n=1 Tax=Treponema sp. TaxID=166 RepID=UPI00298E8601|nr:EAL domain-containing protein [Treponema sp.]MCQ2601995.1 EAL domain-containing protein [Treponema sp.]